MKFAITKSPMEITYKKHGTTIYFAGSDGIDDTKGIIDEDQPIKLVILDELTEFFDDGEGEDELSNIEATFVRGNTGGFQMIYLYNPPKNPNAAINKWCKKDGEEKRLYPYPYGLQRRSDRMARTRSDRQRKGNGRV